MAEINFKTKKKTKNLKGKQENSIITPKFKTPQPDDVVSIMYTSGTTGEPKGVILTNRNCISTAAGHIANNLFLASEELVCLESIFFN